MSLRCLQPSCFPSLQYSYSGLGRISPLSFLVKAGPSVIQISYFSIAVFLNSYRVALCTRYLDVVLQGQKPGCSCQICLELSTLQSLSSHICEVFEDGM